MSTHTGTLGPHNISGLQMIHAIRLILVLAFVSISVPVHSGDSAKLRDFLTLVGFDTFLASIPSGINHAMENSPTMDVDESMREATGDLATTHFDPLEPGTPLVTTSTSFYPNSDTVLPPQYAAA